MVVAFIKYEFFVVVILSRVNNWHLTQCGTHRLKAGLIRRR